jgi:CAAX protease family protein
VTTNDSPAVPDLLGDVALNQPRGAEPGALVPPPSDPDNPPWSVGGGVLVWITSVLLLLLVPLLLVVPYLVLQGAHALRSENLQSDKTIIFLSVLGVIPAHLLTFLVVWLVATAGGKRPFWKAFGWQWAPRFGVWHCVVLALLLYGAGVLITTLHGGGETQLDQIIKSSYATRVVTAILAASTGPLVEELVYRGMLYSALQRALGMVWAVVLVAFLFTGVHVLQYYNNLGVISVIALLSVTLTIVRAYSGRLLPSYIMHLIFNGIQSLSLVLEPYFERYHSGSVENFALLLWHFARSHLN